MKNLIAACWIIEGLHGQCEPVIYLHKPDYDKRTETIHEYETVFHAHQIIRQQRGSKVQPDIFGQKSERETIRDMAEYETLWNS